MAYVKVPDLVRLLSARGKKFREVAESLKMSWDRANQLQKEWTLKVHGRCPHCSSRLGKKCRCKGKLSDNRKVETVLKKLEPHEVLGWIPCAHCNRVIAYTAYHSLRRVSDPDLRIFCYHCRKKSGSIRNVDRATMQRLRETRKAQEVLLSRLLWTPQEKQVLAKLRPKKVSKQAKPKAKPVRVAKPVKVAAPAIEPIKPTPKKKLTRIKVAPARVSKKRLTEEFTNRPFEALAAL
jgi:hypothetical protein